MKNPTTLPGSWLASLLMAAACQSAAPVDYPISPVSLPPRQVHDTFWSPRLQTNRTVSIPHNFEQCKRTGRIDAFLRAAQGREEEVQVELVRRGGHDVADFIWEGVQ